MRAGGGFGGGASGGWISPSEIGDAGADEFGEKSLMSSSGRFVSGLFLCGNGRKVDVYLSAMLPIFGFWEKVRL